MPEADGGMVLAVRTAHAPLGAERRKYRQTENKEMRLVAARRPGQSETYYGAKTGGVAAAGGTLGARRQPQQPGGAT